MASVQKPNHGMALTANQLTVAPVLDLDGTILRTAFDSMVQSAEKLGGIEVIVEGLTGKSLLFQRTFADEGDTLLESEVLDSCAFMPTVRRRLQSILKVRDFEYLKKSIHQLLQEVSVETVDARIEQFTTSLTTEKQNRWSRDFAAEILHYCDPDSFPLMTRWVWDYRANSGVLREIWFSEKQLNYLDIPDGIQAHLELRRELHNFLEDLGVFANHNFMIDVLFAWLYSQYIDSQGGSFLKTDFTFYNSPFGYALRMLGLDSALVDSGKTRLLLPNGKRYSLTGVIDAVTH